MTILTLTEFQNFYLTKRYLPFNLYQGNKNLNEKQLLSKYQKYLKYIENQEIKKQKQIEILKDKQANQEIVIDKKWEEIKNIALQRDNYACRLFSLLTIEEKQRFENSLKDINFLDPYTLDCCHLLSRGRYPSLKYDIDNIFVLYRVFHSRLDKYLNPIDGCSIDRKEHRKWWIRISGDFFIYDKLFSRLRNIDNNPI